MEHQLQRGYTPQTMIHAVNIVKFPKEHRPILRIMAIRYIFMHRKKCTIPKILPTLETLVKITITMFENFLLDRNLEYMSEIADIMHTYGPANYGRNLLDRITDFEQHIANQSQHFQPQPPPKPTIKKTIYSDSQNVHNSKINKTVIHALETIYNIFKKDINLESSIPSEKEKFKNLCLNNIEVILINNHPSKKELINKSISYIKSSISMFGSSGNISLKDAFLCIWLWITQNKHKQELEYRLLEELKEMNGMCTTGHISRLINVIQGFTEDENLSIRISKLDQCNSVIRKYLTDKLSSCTDDKILDGMIDGNDEYIRFIRLKIAEKLISWQQEYGEDILDNIATITNDFAKTTIFQLRK